MSRPSQPCLAPCTAASEAQMQPLAIALRDATVGDRNNGHSDRCGRPQTGL